MWVQAPPTLPDIMIILDIETTGLNPLYHSVLSIGAVQVETGRLFYGECQIEPGSHIDDAALAVNGFTREEATDSSKFLPHELIMEFYKWAEGDTILIGQNVGSFDVQFLKHVTNKHLMKWPFSYRTVDLHSVAFAKFGESVGSAEMYTRLGLDPEPTVHNALVGAVWEWAAFEKLMRTGL